MQPDLEIPPQTVLAALDEMVASESFGKTERPRRFLRHLVETKLRGDGHHLKESVLGTEVFERPIAWDPRHDPIVRQEAARLRKRLAKYYENGGMSSEIRIDLPVGSYVPVFRRAPVELGTSPAPPEPLSAVPAPVRRARILPYAATGLVLAVAAAILVWRGVPHGQPPLSIAVLPFANLTADPANQYFADGLTEEITDYLTRFKTLRVISRSSALQSKRKTADVREAGRLLNVTNILEGSVERWGDRVKIIAHLERVSDGSVIWSNTYERNAADLFAVQSELAAGIAAGLKVAAGAPASRHAPNVQAHDYVMKGRYALEQGTVQSVAEAESDFQQAISLDPQYAAAYFGLGNAAYSRAGATGIYLRTDSERQKAEQNFRKALELDPDLSFAHAALAQLAMQYDWDWGRAEREIQAGLAAPPTAAPESTYAFFLLFRGRFAEADEHIRRYQDLDPFSTATQLNVANMRNMEGRFSEARELAKSLVAANPRLLGGRQLIGLTYIEEGRPDLALTDLEQLKQNVPFAPFREAMARARAGQREQALRLIRPYEEKYPNPGVSMAWFASVYAFMGDEPNTMKWVERSADRHEWAALSIAISPLLASMRNSPAFKSLKRRMGLDF